VTPLPLPELISNVHWLLQNPIDLNGLLGDIWAWATVPNIKNALNDLLALLKRHDVKATFFISGVCAQQNRSEVLKIHGLGHEIGLHGYKHVPYDMPLQEMENDLSKAIAVYREMGITVEGFRAPWLIASEDSYRLAQTFGLKYVSNIKAQTSLQRLDEYGLIQLPIYLEDQTLLQKNATEKLLKSADNGRVFEFHLLYVRQTMNVLEGFLSKLHNDTATLLEIAEGKSGVGLSFDIAYLNRLELIKKIVA
jgi:hypothetical protein